MLILQPEGLSPYQALEVDDIGRFGIGIVGSAVAESRTDSRSIWHPFFLSLSLADVGFVERW